MYIADTLSRAPRRTNEHQLSEQDQCSVMKVSFVPTERLSGLAEHTAADETLQLLSTLIRHGWPDKQSNIPLEIRPYFLVRDEPVLQDGIIVKGHKAVVPAALRDEYYNDIHRGHPGVEATLQRAQSKGLLARNDQIHDQRTETCTVCTSLTPHQQKQPLLPQPVPPLPWSSLATDIFEWHGKHCLVLVDSYSGWFENDLLQTISSEAVIEKLQHHLSVQGSPACIKSDKGRQFTSQAFKNFAKQWDFQRITSSPEFPQSNGLTERAVRSAKQLMERSYLAKSDMYLDLLNLRNIARDPILGSPAQRLILPKPCSPACVPAAFAATSSFTTCSSETTSI